MSQTMSDEWDAIRVLDEKENWIERTAVLSKDDHAHLVQCAKVSRNYSYHTSQCVCMCDESYLPSFSGNLEWCGGCFTNVSYRTQRRYERSTASYLLCIELSQCVLAYLRSLPWLPCTVEVRINLMMTLTSSLLIKIFNIQVRTATAMCMFLYYWYLLFFTSSCPVWYGLFGEYRHRQCTVEWPHQTEPLCQVWPSCGD